MDKILMGLFGGVIAGLFVGACVFIGNTFFGTMFPVDLSVVYSALAAGLIIAALV